MLSKSRILWHLMMQKFLFSGSADLSREVIFCLVIDELANIICWSMQDS